MTNWDAFFQLHADLPREGPGTHDDVAWAVRQAGVASGARILDAGSGPGGDIQSLLDEVPASHITAVDTHADFVERVADRFGNGRVDARQSDMMGVVGPFDFIWCAGAIYFAGVSPALAAWRSALAPGGHVAFTAPCYFTNQPSDGARAFWQGEDGVLTLPEIETAIAAAGYRSVASRPLGVASWEAYYTPMSERIENLRTNADADLTLVLDEAEAEMAAWRAHRNEVGYHLNVVRPL